MSYPCPRCGLKLCSRQVLKRHLERGDRRGGEGPGGENSHEVKIDHAYARDYNLRAGRWNVAEDVRQWT